MTKKLIDKTQYLNPIESLSRLNANIFFASILKLQNTKPDSFLNLTHNINFINITQTKLAEISTSQLIEICADNEEFQNFLIQVVFLRKEDDLYRSDTERKHKEANWSDKLMSIVGSLDGKDILTGVLNHLNDPVRTKKDIHYKPAEAAEIRTEHANYLEGKITIDVVMAEVADGIYNLTQLLTLEPDPKIKELYQKYINQLVEIHNVQKAHMLALVVAKYHFRMYVSKNGRNEYDSEDKLVMEVLANKFHHLLRNRNIAQDILNKSYKKYDDIFAKLRNILIKKFLSVYDDLDESTQKILDKILDEYLQNIYLISKNTTVPQSVLNLISKN